MNLDEIRTSLRIDELREKVRGDGQALPPRAAPRAIGMAALGGVLATAVVAGLNDAAGRVAPACMRRRGWARSGYRP